MGDGGIIERLDRIEKLLIELVELGRKNYLEQNRPQREIRRARVLDEPPDLGDVWEMDQWSDPNELYQSNSAEDPDKGLYETEEEKTAAVKKGEIKGKQVPQKGKAAKAKRRKGTGAPDYD